MEIDLTHGSLFTGLGGFDLGAEMAGIKTIWNYEINEFCNLLNKQNFKNAIQFRDIRGNKQPPKANIISMGSPCQDISIAGNGSGIFGQESGLFFDGMQIVRNSKPDYIIFENSPEILKKGFEYILYQLSECGYNAEWQILSGTTFGMQQSRKRLYLIAYTEEKRLRSTEKTIFSKQILQKQYRGVSPGWRNRRDLPEPRNFGSANGLPDLVDRIKALGNAVMPIVAKYLFECVKNYDK